MKNKIIFIKLASLIILFAIVSFLFYLTGYNKGIKEVNYNYIEDNNDIFGKIDYPLIDLNFNKENKWLIINREILNDGGMRYYIIENASLIDHVKDDLSVNTFPIGRGTTPKGEIYIYKGGKLMKSVPYIDIYFINNDIENLLIPIDYNKIKEDYNIEIPPFI